MSMENDFKAVAGDQNRIDRDYALMRLELIDSAHIEQITVDELKELAKEFHDAQRKLLVTVNKADRQTECGATMTFEKRYRKLIMLVRQHCEPSSEQRSFNVDSVGAKLPKINIKPFDGLLENWVSFKQLFDSLIHKRNISNVEKLHYLLSSVQNKAYDLIKNFPLSDESYLDAYSTLSKYYDKKRQIAISYYEKLVFCEPIKVKSGVELERVGRTFSENLAVLERYNLPDANFMLFYLLWSKLDRVTREAFQLEYNSDEIPHFETLQLFIEKHVRALDNVMVKPPATSIKSNKDYSNIKSKPSFVVDLPTCDLCSGQHSLTKCLQFDKLDVGSRFNFVKSRGLCVSCLSNGHKVRDCTSETNCTVCNCTHHTLLHRYKWPATANSQGNTNTREPDQPDHVVLTSSVKNNVLFSTAKVLVRDYLGNFQSVRVLLDCASACNFISMQCAQRLGLAIKNSSQVVSGIGHSVAEPHGVVSCELRPLHTDQHTYNLDALVLPSICSNQPMHKVNYNNWLHIKNIHLADPDFACPGPIDMLLSASIFASSLVSGLRQGGQGQPKALNTVFGWILMGECEITPNNYRLGDNRHCLFISNPLHDVSTSSLDASIKRFWEVENVVSAQPHLSKEDQKCEDYFLNNYCRQIDGRFVVPLPFVDPSNKPLFKDSRAIALKRFSSLERKLNSNPDFRRAYVAFMDDYAACRHLEEVDPPLSNVGSYYYIPHHGILKPDSVSTPLRVVFDASTKDSDGNSLNESLFAGQKLQTNIFDLLVRFRWHAIVFTGDVKQMYRQILVPDEDAEYQRILWRPSADAPVRDYRLRTVTYGVSSAPYMALRSIAQLARESTTEYPCGSAVLTRDCYVDDIVSGADSVELAVVAREELNTILSSGGFHLRKWTSNNKEFLSGIPKSDLQSEELINFEDASDHSLKILGLLWRSQLDSFQFQVAACDELRCTKRTILSHIARIFDPLGFLGPVTFYAKYLMQLLWASGVAWDEDVPENIALEWMSFKSQLSSLSSLTIPRRVLGDSVVDIQLHGFCDASERGYCAVIYCRSITSAGDIVVQFVCSKSKIAPLRKLSIPRLELQGAVLLADVLSSVTHCLEPLHRSFTYFAWCDSTVTLSWIKSCPSKWKTFVANRVSHIQDLVRPECWRHVATFDNPADCGSRGTLPSEFLRRDSWWTGPSWLSEPEVKWPVSNLSDLDSEVLHGEQKIVTLLINETDRKIVDSLLNKYSSLTKVQRVLAYCFRFRRNSSSKRSAERTTGDLQPDEINKSLMFLVKYVQDNVFHSELKCLKNSTPNSLPKGLRKLSLFIDDAGLLRVGGRLLNANVEFSVKHPVLLPRDHRFTVMLIEDYHKRFMHPGAHTLQTLITQSFWILSAKRAIRSVLSRCINCFRVRPKPALPPLMGNLPSYRVNQLKPFSSVVVDYGGPFNLALGRGRGVKTYKGYICVFVCTSTKAIHIELASELSTEAFIAALKRFCARRGRCSHIVSDQGRNFVGASNYLGTIMQNAAGAQSIKFSFSPPGSPHFNGLAEAGIKSVKTHLSRVIGIQRLTYEEFYTVLSQVEAVLNSRPLTPLSSDANDIGALTPAHFLTLEPLSILPEEDFTAQNISVLHRWKLIQKLHQDFWNRWRSEYIHTLQQRSKWDKSNSNIKVGTLVLITNEQTSSLHWCLGRIVALHPGTDGICRVATVRTATGVYKRPVVKLCPLPIFD